MATESKVKWRDWGDEAFADAKAQDKPVLLGISAVWCHWCHVMDRGVPGDPVHTGVYNNQQLADFINTNYVPVRVDNDQRPDINARYNMGGWPTTCFLTPDGDVIYGGTYFAPSQMRQLLPRVLEVWRDDRGEIEKRLTERSEESSDQRPATSDLDANDIVSSVSNLIIRNFDPKHGGLGTDQKFPMSDAWALLLAVYSQTKERRLLDMVTKTLVAMGIKGMYDLVAGGWFRYSTTPDWSVPHFEKMLEDHGRLLPVYLSAIQALAHPQPLPFHGREEQVPPPARQEGLGEGARDTLIRAARASLDYLTSTLLHDEAGLTYFAGSQDADEEYYLLSRDERARLPAPFIDWRVYADWNALMVSALLQAGVVLGQPNYADLAKRVWHTLVSRCVNDDGSVTHSLLTDGSAAPSVLRGQLGDQAAVAKASLDLAQYDPAMADQALAVTRKVLAFVLRELVAEGGGFYDSPANPDAKGMLRVRIKPIFDNCAIAEALLTMSYLEEGETAQQSRDLALQTLVIFNEEYKRYREHGSPYALAVMRATQLPDEIMIVASADQAASFVRAAHTSYSPWRIMRVLDPMRDAAFIAERGYPVRKLPVAFVCKGTTCSAPILDAERLAIGD